MQKKWFSFRESDGRLAVINLESIVGLAQNSDGTWCVYDVDTSGGLPIRMTRENGAELLAVLTQRDGLHQARSHAESFAVIVTDDEDDDTPDF